MKISTYLDSHGNSSWGLIVEERIYDVPKASQALGYGNPYPEVLALMKSGQQGLEELRSLFEKIRANDDPEWQSPLLNTHLQAPVPIPESIRDYGLFERHIIECIREVGLGKLANLDRKLDKVFGSSLAKRINAPWYEQPAFYKGNRFAVVGPEQDIEIPTGCQQFDFELEFGVFIGQTGKNISASQAKEHIFGVCLLNDFSARDIQMREMKSRMGPAKGKDFDGGFAMGPYILTLDEIDDLYNLDFQVYVNDELFGGGNSADMHWRFEEVIEYTSKNETLYPGELLGSGTISGQHGPGCGLEISHFVKSGDTIELRNGLLGTLRNKVV